MDDFKNAWTKPPVFDKDNSAINYPRASLFWHEFLPFPAKLR